MLIPKEALYRTLIGTVLKSVGITARILDVPKNQPELKKRVTQRELIDLGVIVGASLILEGVFHKLKARGSKINAITQFLPQLMAYVFAEWFSRKVTNYQRFFHSTLKDAPKDTGFINYTQPKLVMGPLSVPVQVEKPRVSVPPPASRPVANTYVPTHYTRPAFASPYPAAFGYRY